MIGRCASNLPEPHLTRSALTGGSYAHDTCVDEAQRERVLGLQTIGWREWVGLPALGGAYVKAKVDTGAKTSSLHAFGLELTEADGEITATFELHADQRKRSPTLIVSAAVKEIRRVKSSSGHTEERPIVTTPVQLGGAAHLVDLSLTNRDEMGFRMLLGRSAIRRRFVVDPSRSYLQNPKPNP